MKKLKKSAYGPKNLFRKSLWQKKNSKGGFFDILSTILDTASSAALRYRRMLGLNPGPRVRKGLYYAMGRKIQF
jgi:hypothetical protein